MIEYINTNPLKATIFSILFVIGIIIIFLNLKNPKKLFFLMIFYIPLSFRSSMGSLVIYLIILLFLISLTEKSYDYKYNFFSIDNILVILILLCTTFSAINLKNISVFYYDQGKIKMTFEYLIIVSMLSNYALYSMVKRYISTKEDIKKALHYMVISGFIASVAGYLQRINPSNTLIFKYIIISENPKWSSRVAATMPGYELLSEYTAILMIFSLLFYLISNGILRKMGYILILFNFLIILMLTQTRGIFISSSISILYLTVFLFLIGKMIVGTKVLISLLLTITIFIGSAFSIDYLFSSSNLVERFQSLDEINIKEGKYATRTMVWSYGLKSIKKMSTKELFFGAGKKYFSEKDGKGQALWPHNLYLSYILRDGFSGLIVFIVFLCYIYWKSIKDVYHKRFIKDKDLFNITLALHLSFVVFIIDEFKIEFIRHDRMQSIIWLIFGLIFAAAKLPNKWKSYPAPRINRS